MARKGKKVDPLVVQSKVKGLVKKAKMNCAADVVLGLTQIVEGTISSGVRRAKSNGRKTLRADDL